MAPKKKSTHALVPTKARALSAKEFLDLADALNCTFYSPPQTVKRAQTWAL